MANRNLSSILFFIGIVAGVAIALIGRIWAFLYFVVYLGYGNYKVYGHQEFASNGVSQIAPAMQMDRLFADCRHYITYGPSDVAMAQLYRRGLATPWVPMKGFQAASYISSSFLKLRGASCLVSPELFDCATIFPP